MNGGFGGEACRITANELCASQSVVTRLECSAAYFLGGCATDELPLSDPYAPGVNKRISTSTPVLGSALVELAQNWSSLWNAPLEATLQEALLNATSNYYWSGLGEDAAPAPSSVTCFDWSSTSPANDGAVGSSTSLTAWWSPGALALCSSFRPLVCVCLTPNEEPTSSPTPRTCTKIVVQ